MLLLFESDNLNNFPRPTIPLNPLSFNLSLNLVNNNFEFIFLFDNSFLLSSYFWSFILYVWTKSLLTFFIGDSIISSSLIVYNCSLLLFWFLVKFQCDTINFSNYSLFSIKHEINLYYNKNSFLVIDVTFNPLID